MGWTRSRCRNHLLFCLAIQSDRLIYWFRFLVIRYAHILTWLLIAINFILRGLSPSYNGITNLIAAMGGAIYLLFIVMTFVVK